MMQSFMHFVQRMCNRKVFHSVKNYVAVAVYNLGPKVEAICFSRMLVHSHKITQCINLQDNHPYS
jgi:hypothetical protein